MTNRGNLKKVSVLAIILGVAKGEEITSDLIVAFRMTLNFL